jgi:4-amino-4-deoxy-L-arabinose transferase-like glycosyltransferase
MRPLSQVAILPNTRAFNQMTAKTTSNTTVTSPFTDRRLPMLLALACGLVLFVNLGAAALFEPDEGRNAERAREILLLGNWAIPHENFLPALDKPIFFYWLIAISYKLFGISEWSARLPSALAAIGCLIVLYRFVDTKRSHWESFASILILATSLQFFLFARIVIFDMTLTFFTSIALFEFYRATVTENRSERLWRCLMMYAAMALATLVKGPIGLAIPGMVIFCYLLIARKWRLLGEIHLILGALMFCAIVVPVYLWTEFKNPGYLRYFLWEENVLRFFTPHFQRGQAWYYYALVITLGYLPWSVLIPTIFTARWKKKLDDRDLFLLLWIVLPLLFFSLSSSKLPHYVLPIFPPLAILTAARLMEIVQAPAGASRWPLGLPLLVSVSVVFHLVVGTVWRQALPRQIREDIGAIETVAWLSGIAIAIVGAIFLVGRGRGKWRRPGFVLGCYGAALLVYLLLMLQLSIQVSYRRSAKLAAEHFAKFISPTDQLVHYDGSLTGMPFYLRSQKPIWIVWSGTDEIVMDNIYIAQKQPAPVAGYGQVLFTYSEFAQATQQPQQPLRIIVKTKNLNRLWTEDGIATKTLTEYGGYSLVTPQ